MSLSPSRRAWLRFKRHRLGYWSLILFSIVVVVSLFAELLSNDKPLIARYDGHWYAPIFQSVPETAFGGDFETTTDYLDPFIVAQFKKPGNFAIYPPNHYHFNTINYFAKEPNPSGPSADNWLGTDDRGRDVFARLLYGFRISVLFGLALTVFGVLLGVFTGALQGFYGGKTDLIAQRVIEIWGAMPELYLLIIFAAVFDPSLGLLLLLLSLFGWMGLSDYVRAEFLRNRQLDYVRAAKALGLSNGQIMWRHILPNAVAPVIVVATIALGGYIALEATLSFLGIGLQDPTISWGIDINSAQKLIRTAPFALFFPAGMLSITVLAFIMLGDAVRDALDPKLR